MLKQNNLLCSIVGEENYQRFIERCNSKSSGRVFDKYVRCRAFEWLMNCNRIPLNESDKEDGDYYDLCAYILAGDDDPDSNLAEINNFCSMAETACAPEEADRLASMRKAALDCRESSHPSFAAFVKKFYGGNRFFHRGNNSGAPQLPAQYFEKRLAVFEADYDLDAVRNCKISTGLDFLYSQFNLSVDELLICEFFYILSVNEQSREFFLRKLDLGDLDNIRILETVLGLNSARPALANLINCGLIREYHGSVACSGFLTSVFKEQFSPEKSIYSELKVRPLTLNHYLDIRPDTVIHLEKLIKNKDRLPVNILLYGVPGSGKTTFVQSLARNMGYKAFTVNSRLEDDDGDRRASFLVTQNMMRKSGKAIVLLDEAERLLCTDFRNVSGSRNKDKAWLNSLLERTGCATFWICNDISHVDDAVLRRFAFKLEFSPIDAVKRLNILKMLMDDEGIKTKLPAADLKRIAKTYPVEAAGIAKAVSQTKLLYPHTRRFGYHLELVLASECNAVAEFYRSRKNSCESSKKRSSRFTLDGLCVKTDDFKAELERFKKLDTYIRKHGSSGISGSTVLFYGPPGTGKSELAKYIARSVKRDPLIVKASDLLDCYVGNTEKKIHAVFARAQAEGKVLIFDEADSFLGDRTRARNNWEVTQVNQFLTELESYRGFCICTTNFDRNLDAASLRRFVHKLEFTYAGLEQAKALYHSILEPLSGMAPNREEQEQLFKLKNLTPGDFHVVEAQFNPVTTEKKERTNARLIAALERECAMKPSHSLVKQQRIGF